MSPAALPGAVFGETVSAAGDLPFGAVADAPLVAPDLVAGGFAAGVLVIGVFAIGT